MNTPAIPVAPGATPSAAPPSPTFGAGARLLRWIKGSPLLHAVVVVVLAVALVALAITHLVEVARVEDRAAADRAALVEKATSALDAQTSALLRLSALPLGWAIRDALLKDDLTSADTYLQRIVHERNVTGAALIGADGKVRLASNRKLETHSAAEAFPGIAINQESPMVVPTTKALNVVVPIMGYDRKLGTLIFSYARPSM